VHDREVLSRSNYALRSVVALAAVADADGPQILVVQFCQRAKVDARSRVVIRAGKIQAKDGETG
jgi:hypothetical protein